MPAILSFCWDGVIQRGTQPIGIGPVDAFRIREHLLAVGQMLQEVTLIINGLMAFGEYSLGDTVAS
jgi:hypothetical protein